MSGAADAGQLPDAAASRCMDGVHGKHLPQVPLAEDQHPVGDLGPHGQNEGFGEAVRSWTPRRDLDHLDARIGQEPRRTMP